MCREVDQHLQDQHLHFRQRLSRFVRKTLSFSKSHYMHYYCCLKVFVYRYNLERRNIILG